MPEEYMDNPLPGAEMMAQEEAGGKEVEVKQMAEDKLGAVVQEVGRCMETLVAAEVIEEGDDTFKALAAIMANAQTALDALSNDMPAEINNEPEVVTPSAGEAATTA